MSDTITILTITILAILTYRFTKIDL